MQTQQQQLIRQRHELVNFILEITNRKMTKYFLRCFGMQKQEHQLKCSLKETFFQFNQNLLNCPNFRIITFNQQKFIYLNYLDNFYRIKEHSPNDSPQSIWMNMIIHNENINEISILGDILYSSNLPAMQRQEDTRLGEVRARYKKTHKPYT